MKYNSFYQVTNIFEKRAKRLAGCESWLHKAKNSKGTSWEQYDKILLTRLDAIISIMPDSERDNLTRKFSDIIPSGSPGWNEEYDKQFWEVLVEVPGYGWLNNRFPSYRVNFEEPDLVVRDNKLKLVATMACKRIRTSDANEQFFKRQKETGEVVCKEVDIRVLNSNPAENPFLNKLTQTLSLAKTQLNRVNSKTKFIFLSISWDVSAAISKQKTTVVELIKKEASNLSKSGITEVDPILRTG